MSLHSHKLSVAAGFALCYFIILSCVCLYQGCIDFLCALRWTRLCWLFLLQENVERKTMGSFSEVFFSKFAVVAIDAIISAHSKVS